jgi:hypothetical protein
MSLNILIFGILDYKKDILIKKIESNLINAKFIQGKQYIDHLITQL